ncbi:MAG TPA: TetR/AcrR family transcriptional regulator [Polyangiaceae bacterium]|nr:TetR/AcrR family transcriptional regulator [Polyangiaceae bacterium]
MVPPPDDTEVQRTALRERILEAARRLILEGGKDAATTRAVAAAASVQAPTIYRLFGDKEGLLDATAQFALEKYVAAKRARAPHPDPIQDLRSGWDEHVAFGLSQPSLFALMNGDQRFQTTPAARSGEEVLRKKLRRLAEQGLLRVSEDRALALLQAVGVGVIKRLLEQPANERDLGLADLARESVIHAIAGKRNPPVATGAVGAAVALKAGLDSVNVLSAGERLLLEELLERIASADASAPRQVRKNRNR